MWLMLSYSTFNFWKIIWINLENKVNGLTYDFNIVRLIIFAEVSIFSFVSILRTVSVGVYLNIKEKWYLSVKQENILDALTQVQQLNGFVPSPALLNSPSFLAPLFQSVTASTSSNDQTKTVTSPALTSPNR